MIGFPFRLWMYIGRLFLQRFLVVFVVLIVILQTLDLVGVSNAIMAKHPNETGILFSYIKLRIPTLAVQFLPFSVLIASLATLGGLAQSNEITSARSMGMTRLQIGLPMIVISAMLGLLHLLSSQTLALHSGASLAAWQAVDYKGMPNPPQSPAKKPLWINDGIHIFHAGHVMADLRGLKLQDVQVISFDPGQPLASMVYARSGTIINGFLRVENGMFISPPAAATVLATSWQMPIKIDARDLVVERMKPKSASLINLLAAAESGIPDAVQRAAVATQIHHRFSTIMLITLLPLAAIAVIGGQPRSRHRLWSMAAGLALGFVFFVFDSVMFGIANAGSMPGWLAAWGTVALFAGITMSMLLRSET